jgi:hypothetical protein
MTEALITSVLVGIGIGIAHYLAHTTAGDESQFEGAGVEAAGITVVVAGTVATYLILTLTGVA